MPLPTNFDDTEHLQATVRRYINSQVREDFADLNDAAGNWEPAIGTTRASMRKALTHEDSDSLLVTGIRMLLYYFTFNKAQQLQAPIYGMPANDYDRYSVYKPQIVLSFRQAANTVTAGEVAARGEISFRLMNETSTSLTNAEVNNYATKINTKFSGATKFVWKKGKVRVTYNDLEKGYQLKLDVLNKAEGERIIKEILEIQSHTFSSTFMNTIENENPTGKYPNTPGTHTILGKVTRKPLRRPVENVEFKNASLLIWGRPNPITLVDTTNRRPSAIIRS